MNDHYEISPATANVLFDRACNKSARRSTFGRLGGSVLVKDQGKEYMITVPNDCPAMIMTMESDGLVRFVRVKKLGDHGGTREATAEQDAAIRAA